jgi:hypothetical protein
MKLPKLSIKDILLVTVIGFIIFTQFFAPSDDPNPEPVTISIPEVTGTVEETVEDVVETVAEIHDPVTKTATKIIVDQEYKKKYEEAIKENNSLKAMNIFLKSIEINEYNKVLVDNDTIKLVAYAKTRGEILKYSIDYTIKENTINYIPEFITKRPKFTLLAGGGLIVPMDPLNQTMAFKADIGFQNQKGNIIDVGYDTQQNIYVGYKHAIKLGKISLNPFKKKK